MTDSQLRILSLPGSAADGGRSWQPRLELMAQRPVTAERSLPVLYVHGATFPCATSIFFRLGGWSWADSLNAAGFSIWGLDFAGFGRSERYPEMGPDSPPAGTPLGRAPDAVRQLERAVRAIVAETGAARVQIVAHSWGTIVAGRFAGQCPDLVDRLVLFGPIARREALPGMPSLAPWRYLTVREQRDRFVEDVPPGEAEVLAAADFPAWADLYLAADPTSGARSPPSVKTPNGPVADIMSAWSGDLAYDPAAIPAPVLIVCGAWDSLCGAADIAWLRQALTGAPEVRTVTVPKATHLMHLESGRTALHAATTDFLRQG
ncbi:alpha/beta hydrolase [Marinibaculum pumilum]|uniref:Alpha/beta hydrolase n=1 Tax=Marinibaculum pumilum TaxID=1766165 RepID=A0ABV7KW31_9PROT